MTHSSPASAPRRRRRLPRFSRGLCASPRAWAPRRRHRDVQPGRGRRPPASCVKAPARWPSSSASARPGASAAAAGTTATTPYGCGDGTRLQRRLGRPLRRQLQAHPGVHGPLLRQRLRPRPRRPPQPGVHRPLLRLQHRPEVHLRHPAVKQGLGLYISPSVSLGYGLVHYRTATTATTATAPTTTPPTCSSASPSS
jgi:hypothetical protein